MLIGWRKINCEIGHTNRKRRSFNTFQRRVLSRIPPEAENVIVWPVVR